MESEVDPLGDVLRLLRLRACVYFQSDFRSPWGMEIPSNDAAQFHLVVWGGCRLCHDGEERILSSGDVVVFPHGNSHRLLEGEPKTFTAGQQVLQAIQSKHPIFQEGPRVSTRLMCGHFELDRSLRHPLIKGLPQLIHIRGLDPESSLWSSKIAEVLLREQEHGLAGSSEIVVRLAESMFIQVLRAHMDQDTTAGFLCALSDRRLYHALKLLHSTHDGMTLESLAKTIGMSRSSLAARFKQTIGQSPMKYLAGWRLTKAKSLLEHTDKPISVIAEDVGYTSEASFSRAFKDHVGVPPGTIRKHAKMTGT